MLHPPPPSMMKSVRRPAAAVAVMFTTLVVFSILSNFGLLHSLASAVLPNPNPDNKSSYVSEPVLQTAVVKAAVTPGDSSFPERQSSSRSMDWKLPLVVDPPPMKIAAVIKEVLNNSTVTNTRRHRKILFVHVGKAGGETIKNILEMGCKSRKNKRRRNECLQKVPDSALNQQVHGYFHCFTIEPRSIQADSFLFNLRHPVDRAVSWYRYVHPGHCPPAGINSKKNTPVCIAQRQLQSNPGGWVGQFFQQCFPTVQDWALPQTTKCQELALQTYQGTLSEKEVPLAAHMIANLRHYVEKTGVMANPSVEILVVRTASLWQDLNDLDAWMGGTGDFGEVEGLAVTHGSEHYNKQDNNNNNNDLLSDKAAAQLCCALKEEIEWYRTLVQRAANLVDKEQELQRLVQRCGAQTWDEWLRNCDESHNEA
jgi:hypothetical protein